MQRQTHTEGRQYEDTGRRRPCNWSDGSVSQGTPRIASKCRKPEEARKSSRLEPSEGARPCGHLDFGLLEARPLRQYISVVLSHLVCGILFWQPQTTSKTLLPHIRASHSCRTNPFSMDITNAKFRVVPPARKRKKERTENI